MTRSFGMTTEGVSEAEGYQTSRMSHRDWFLSEDKILYFCPRENFEIIATNFSMRSRILIFSKVFECILDFVEKLQISIKKNSIKKF